MKGEPSVVRWSPWLEVRQDLLDPGVAEPCPTMAWASRIASAISGLPAARERSLPELARGADPLWQAALRQLRNREQCRFIYRDLNRLCTLSELTRELSDFADAVLDVALAQAHAEVALLHGKPVGADSGKQQHMVILGMGKLGGQELNLSSDIDLVFAYAEEGETDGRRGISNQEFFTKVGQRVIQYLGAVTADGFVFRVDMRLRPWGDGAPLALSFDATENYYERHGREWERYALIKARVCAGDREGGERLLRALRPFVFRRYIDFGAFASLREMKAMIEAEVRRNDREDNIKLGSGGIREIEFIAQAFQLIRGGVDTALQERQLLRVLPLLGERGLLPATAVDELVAAYHFLRDSEHRIQALHDRQTQTLPVDVADRQRLAEAMGYADWPAYLAELGRHRAIVQGHFDNVIVVRGQDGREQAPPAPDAWPAPVRTLLASRAIGQLSATARERLDRLLPQLVIACRGHAAGEQALARIIPLIEATLRRSAYLVLLSENPGALERLIDLCAASPWMAELLTRYPALLDELLNAATLYAPPSREELAAELRAQLARVPGDDLERQMDILRIFQKGQLLRVAASDLKGTLALMKISDSLTWIAEVVLQEVLNLSWRQLVARHGVPLREDGTPCDGDFIIVGYGKLGGIELGYGSDLDLVFIHDADPQCDTNGDRPLDGGSFFARLGQKIIHLLTAPMAAGQLYEVDMRLRPSGASGLLVTSLAGFAQYQREHAWTWEHQALVRARVVAGDPALAARFEAERAAVIARPRERAQLRREVAEMREKMRQQLAPKEPGVVDVKHSPGGLVDIEFLVQYLTLAHAAECPGLTRWTDNVRLLETLAKVGVLSEADAGMLTRAYLALRAAGHRRALAQQGRGLAEDELVGIRGQVSMLYGGVMW